MVNTFIAKLNGAGVVSSVRTENNKEMVDVVIPLQKLKEALPDGNNYSVAGGVNIFGIGVSVNFTRIVYEPQEEEKVLVDFKSNGGDNETSVKLSVKKLTPEPTEFTQAGIKAGANIPGLGANIEFKVSRIGNPTSGYETYACLQPGCNAGFVNYTIQMEKSTDGRIRVHFPAGVQVPNVSGLAESLGIPAWLSASSSNFPSYVGFNERGFGTASTASELHGSSWDLQNLIGGCQRP